MWYVSSGNMILAVIILSSMCARTDDSVSPNTRPLYKLSWSEKWWMVNGFLFGTSTIPSRAQCREGCSCQLTKMYNFLMSIAIHRVCFEIAMQHISLWMQNDSEMPPKGLKFDFFYNIKWMIALFCATFDDSMNNIIGMYGFIIMKIFT